MRKILYYDALAFVKLEEESCLFADELSKIYIYKFYISFWTPREIALCADNLAL